MELSGPCVSPKLTIITMDTGAPLVPTLTIRGELSNYGGSINWDCTGNALNAYLPESCRRWQRGPVFGLILIFRIVDPGLRRWTGAHEVAVAKHVVDTADRRPELVLIQTGYRERSLLAVIAV